MMTDESILIDPTGSVVWRYEKTHLVPEAERMYLQECKEVHITPERR